jgi:glucokinase
MRTVVGIDLGGTKVKARAYLEDGSAASQRHEAESKAKMGAEVVVAAIVNVARKCAAEAGGEMFRVGVAVPGHIDSRTGTVIWAPNFGEERDGLYRNWENVPLGPLLESALGCPVILGNDANLAALGEYRHGVGRGTTSCLVLLTLGTGIGGGVIFGPESLHGSYKSPLMLVGCNQGGAELGHSVILHGGLDCTAGSYGSVEAYCGTEGIMNRAIHRIKRGRQTSIRPQEGKSLAELEPLDLSIAAQNGDDLAIEVFREIGTLLGVAIGSYINVFAPSIVAIGGQVAKAGDFLIKPATASALNVAIPSLFASCEIKMAERIDDGGILGAAELALMT